MGAREREELDEIIGELRDVVEGALQGVEEVLGETVLILHPKSIHEALALLKTRGFDLLLDIACVDALGLKREERFEVVYILYSIPKDLRLRLRVFLPEAAAALPTASDLWRSADWAEREAFDMFGVRFEGHPNLKRILCHHEFQGHALRKDYPIMKGQWCSGTRDLREDLEPE